MLFKKHIFICQLFLILFFSCSKPVELEDMISKDYYVNVEKSNSISISALQFIYSVLGMNDMVSSIKYPVDFYTLTYRSTYKGNKIIASGVIALPVGMTKKTSIVSIQHGTIIKKDQAPSELSTQEQNEYIYLLGMASTGIVVLMPDYFGFGSSKNLFHPYYDSKQGSRAVIDMIYAAKEYLFIENIETNGKLFLAGYSEGGYVTAVTLREIEENTDLKVEASAIGAPGINLSYILKNILAQKKYDFPSFMGYIYLSYRDLYGWEDPISDVFSQKYAERLLSLYDGIKSSSEINLSLTNDIEEMLTADFLQIIRSDGKNKLLDSLKMNSWNTWIPKGEVRFYHGDNDEVIPYSDFTKYREYVTSGVSHDNISFFSVQGGTHSSSALSMFKDCFSWLQNRMTN